MLRLMLGTRYVQCSRDWAGAAIKWGFDGVVVGGEFLCGFRYAMVCSPGPMSTITQSQRRGDFVSAANRFGDKAHDDYDGHYGFMVVIPPVALWLDVVTVPDRVIIR